MPQLTDEREARAYNALLLTGEIPVAALREEFNTYWAFQDAMNRVRRALAANGKTTRLIVRDEEVHFVTIPDYRR